MKKSFLLGTLMVSMLAACSQDEVISFNQDEISYGAVTGKQTRAANNYCNNALPAAFNVWAKHISEDKTTQKDFILGDVISNNDGVWTNSVTRYWPNSGTLDFYAHVNAGNCFNWNNGAPTINDFTIGTDASQQKDLLYAVKKEQSRQDGKVTLNFRHALSQVVFKAKNTNEKLHVEIEGITVGNINSKGTYTYPTEATDNNYVDHTGTGVGVYPTNGQGIWTSSDAINYSVIFTPVKLDGDGNVYSLTNPEDESDKGDKLKNTLMLLPQMQTAWDPHTPATSFIGSFFFVKCKIYNVAGDQFDQANDVLLWGDATTGAAKEIAIPVTINWEQGKKYIYTFVFSNGNGGYIPDPNDPQPALAHISFDVTVDDFFPVENDADMDVTPKTNSVNTSDYNGSTW